jgi:hypothetical protein
MAKFAAGPTEVFDRLDRSEKVGRRLKRAGLAVLVLAPLILLAASAVAQVGVPGGVNTPPSGLSGNATQIQGKAVDAPATLGQMPFYNGTKIGWFIDPVVRMNRDCGIVGSGDETAALNTCIANLPNYTGVLQCDKPGMAIHTTGAVVRDKVGIRIETAGGGHTLSHYCQLVYTGRAGGTVVDVERTRDSVIFKGFQINAGAADVAFQTGQTGSGTNIATGDSFEELLVSNNNGRSTFVGFRIGDSTNQNSDEMKFQHVHVTSAACKKCGIAFQQAAGNVYGTQFRDIILTNMAIGWDWAYAASIDKVNGYDIALLYRLGVGNDQTFHVKNEDLETVDQILKVTAGSTSFIEERGRVVLRVPGQGGVTGTADHPAWDFSNGGGNHSSIKNMHLGAPQQLTGLTFVKGTANIASVDLDFYDPGCNTFAYANCAPGPNALNFRQPTGFLAAKGAAPGIPWVGRGFIDTNGMVVPSEGMLQADNGGVSQNHTPCGVGNVCLGDGQVELTGIHSILSNPTFRYAGATGSTNRTYAIVACSDTSCAVGNRSLPATAGTVIRNTASTLDASNYVTATWTPALGANKYGILQSNPSNAFQFNLLMSNISCSANPCTVKITTDSSTYTTAYPADNETGGVVLRGAIKMGKSATQMAAVDFTYAKVTGLVVPGAVGALAYNHSGTQQTVSHLVVDSCTLGTDCSVTLTGAAVFTSSSSYSCVCQDKTAMASCKADQTSGSTFAIVGRGTDAIGYFCAGN